jgi:glycerophosphoryl diester phosphodiesterase
MRHASIVFSLCALLCVLGYAWHGGRATETVVPTFAIVAHRGVHSAWDLTQYDRRTGCEARHMVPPLLPVIENTLESVALAFEAGATMVEVDIRLTKDRKLAVFHDVDLGCRTDGRGRVNEKTLSELQALDIGYGYTLHGQSHFPSRGRGVGKLPALDAVLTTFSGRDLLIDHKDQSQESAAVLGTQLEVLPATLQKAIYYWGPRRTFAEIVRRAPGVRRLLLDRTELKSCLMPYLLTLGAAGFGDACRHEGIGLPYRFAKVFWGWPHRLLQKAHAVGARVYILTDSPEDAREVAVLPIDGIITDNILEVGPAVSRARNLGAGKR